MNLLWLVSPILFSTFLSSNELKSASDTEVVSLVDSKKVVEILERLSIIRVPEQSLAVFSQFGLTFDRKGSTKLYSYYSVARMYEYEIDYSVDKDIVISSFWGDFSGKNEKQLVSAIIEKGYKKFDTQRSNKPMLIDGKMKTLLIVEEYYSRVANGHKYTAKIRSIYDGSSRVDFLVGIHTAK